MAGTRLKTVKIATGRDEAPLSRTQKTFNTRIKQIETLRAQRVAWETASAIFQQTYSREVHPLDETWMQLEAKLVHRLDLAHDEPGLTGTERRIIRNIVVEIARELLEERDDAALKAVYNKYAPTDFDAEQAAELESTKSMLEEAWGVDLGDEADATTPEELVTRARARMEKDQQNRDARRAEKKKSPKKLAREAKRQAEEAKVHQSMREIYRKLASALHPDRELDPAERDRKTALMQRVNQAYDRKNLLQLLELQLELEHIGQGALDNLNEERLMRYNQVLKDQIRELEQEIQSVEEPFRIQFGIPPSTVLLPEALTRYLTADIAALREGIRDMERDIKACDNIQMLKTWLRKWRRRPTDDNERRY